MVLLPPTLYKKHRCLGGMPQSIITTRYTLHCTGIAPFLSLPNDNYISIFKLAFLLARLRPWNTLSRLSTVSPNLVPRHTLVLPHSGHAGQPLVPLIYLSCMTCLSVLTHRVPSHCSFLARYSPVEGFDAPTHPWCRSPTGRSRWPCPRPISIKPY